MVPSLVWVAGHLARPFVADSSSIIAATMRRKLIAVDR